MNVNSQKNKSNSSCISQYQMTKLKSNQLNSYIIYFNGSYLSGKICNQYDDVKAIRR